MNSTLKKGMRGDNVKELQQLLKEAGYFNYPTNTGYFGDITEQALKDYQQAKGQPVTGEFDNNSSGLLKVEKTTQDFLNKIKGTEFEDIFSTLAKNNDPRLQQTISAITNPLNQGVFLGGGTVISPEQLKGYEDIVSSEVDPYYTQKGNFDRGIYSNDVASNQQDYSQTVNDMFDQAASDTIKQSNNEGIQGTWASSGRKERANTLMKQYNTALERAAQKASSVADRLNMNREYNYGVNSTDNSPINTYKLGLSEAFSPNIDITGTSSYDSLGLGKGIIPTQQYTAKKSKVSDLVNSQYYNPLKNL